MTNPDDHTSDETLGASTPISPRPGAGAGRGLGPPATFAEGEILAGRYRIVRFIAQGGMGEVYEAEDQELSGRVALKTIRPEIAEEAGSIDRFKREVHLARQVTHPNVSRIYDVDRQGRTTFLTMELLHGETLADRLARVRRFDTAEARPIVTQIAAGLAAAHRVGVVHRDFKSANVMLEPGPAEEGGVRAVVTDFGLARRSRAGEGDSASMTQGIVGTPAYMAPEQVEGGRITPATDIYALGIVIYEMVTGDRPFTGDTPISVALKRVKQSPPSPRTRVPDLDPKWEKAILRCLERDPADRFATATDVVRALGGESVRSNPRRQRLALAAVGALVVLAGGLGYYFARGGGGRPSVQARRSVAVLGFKNLAGRPDAAWLSTALSEMLTTELAAGEKLRTVPGESVARMKSDLALTEADGYAKDTLAHIRQNIDAGYVVVGSYLAVAGAPVRVDLRLQDARAGETIATVSESGTEAELAGLVARAGGRLREKLGIGTFSPEGADPVRASLPANPGAARLYSEGLQKLRSFDNLAARDLLEKAIEADPGHALSHSALANAWRATGYDGKAAAEARKALDLSAGLLREDRLSIEGQYHVAAKDWPKAIESYRTLWRLFPDNLEYGLRLADALSWGGKGNDALEVILSLRRLPGSAGDDPRIDLAAAVANGRSGVGRYRESEAAARGAVEKAGKSGARQLVAEGRYWQGRAFVGIGEYAKGLAALTEARGSYSAIGDRRGEGLAVTLVGWTLMAQGDLPRAMEESRSALEISGSIGDRRNVADITSTMCQILKSQGELTKALKTCDDSIAIYQEVGDQKGVAGDRLTQGQILSRLTDYPNARKKLTEALNIFRALGDSGTAAYAYHGLGDVAFAEGELSEADAAFGKARELAHARGLASLDAYILRRLGEVSLAMGDLPNSRTRLEEARKLFEKSGLAGEVAGVKESLAELAREEGRPAEAERLAREAAAEWAREKSDWAEAYSHVQIAMALLPQGNVPEARVAIDRARFLAQKSENRILLLDIATAAGRVDAASGKARETMQGLTSALAEARRIGNVPSILEARLALGETEMKFGDAGAGRARLDALERDAKARGFLLIARKAAKARR